MYGVTLPADADETRFREIARRCLTLAIAPWQLSFSSDGETSLFAEPPAGAGSSASFSVPRSYGDLLKDAICHRAPDRFALLYDVLWRIRHGARGLAQNSADPAVARLETYAHHVRRDVHKMHAFLRFREQCIDGGLLYSAWFEPQHFILRQAAPFFVDRFSNMDWIIVTPLGTAAWNRSELVFGPPAAHPRAPRDAVLDETWLAYYRVTFNPARLRLKAMAAEMPRRYWANMPETSLIPEMVRAAGERLDDMAARSPLPPPRFAERIVFRAPAADPASMNSLAALKDEIAHCRRCPLHCPATQAVSGEGPSNAAIMLVGEQPGDAEDLAGRPFVGPAGQLLAKALAVAGLDRGKLYLTNTVKHFKFEPRGKRRIHQKPDRSEVEACKWWLDREIALLKPRLVVALGATAASALAGRTVSVIEERGPALFGEVRGFVTVHPSFLLRLPDAAAQEREYRNFVEDLRRVASCDTAEPQ
ncbi:MAG: UdgX family uracil-DNA binding protein [Parvibaculaceae bacterium]